MALRYGYFDSDIIGVDEEGMPIFDRAETSDLFALLFANLVSDGVLALPANCFRVSAAGDGLSLNIDPGFAMVKGHFCYNDEVSQLTLGALPQQYSRIDRVVLRCNYLDRMVEIVVKAGVEAATPVPPELVRPAAGDYYELCLANVKLTVGQQRVTQSSITDTRADSSVCGFITQLVDHLDTAVFFGQLDAFYQEFMASLNVKAQAVDDLIASIPQLGAFTGATETENGKMGLVPVPLAGDVDKVLGANGKWVAKGGGATIHVVTADPGLYGRTVTATDGTVTMAGKFDLTGQCYITNVLMNGKVTVGCSNAEGKTAEQEIVVTYYATYYAELDSRKPTNYINVTTAEGTLFGKTVTASNGTERAEAVIGQDGTARVKVQFAGTVAVAASDGVNTVSAAVEVAEGVSAEYGVTLRLYHLTVTTTEARLDGKTVTLGNSGGTETRTAVFAGGTAEIVFDAGFVGECTVSAADGASTASEMVNVSAGNYSYSTELTFSTTYSAILDFSKSDPSGMVSYADGAAGMAKGWSNWKDKPIFKELRCGQCVLKNGVVQYYLNPDNIAKKADGTTADITTLGNDVMQEIPFRLGYMIKWLDAEMTKLKVSVTDHPNKAGYEYDAFSLDSYNDCDKIYIGVFKGHASGNAVYSSSGKAVGASQTIDTFRTWCRARGSGYQQRTYGSVKLMQCLYIIAHGALNSQEAVGMGYVNTTITVYTGGTNAYGFDSELIRASNPSYMTDGKHQVKCLGLEDFWGGFTEFVDGVRTDANRNVLTCRCAKDFNTAGTGYTNNGNGGITSTISGYISKPIGGNGAGFAAMQADGSSSAFFCDSAYVAANGLALLNSWNHGEENGAFYLGFTGDASYISKSRLMYMHKETA